jgi:hypothetical protein
MTPEQQAALDAADKIRAGLKATQEAEENVDTGADEGDDNDNTETENKPKGDEKPKLSDNDAKLLKEVMKHKAAAKKAADDLKALTAKYEGIDLEAVQALLAQKDTDENTALEKKGEYDRLLAKQREAADAKVAAEKARADAAETERSKLLKQIEDLTTGSAFSNSKFVTEKLTLTPNKAKALYKSHFEFVDGKMVGYDKPAGESDRTPIVDASGETVAFEDAIAAIIDADPDKDYLLKADMKSGSGSKPAATEKPKKQSDYSDTTDKIAAGLDAFIKASKKS